MGKGSKISWNPEEAFGASAVLEGLAALAIAIAFICALVRIRINGDAARKCFLWLFAALVLAFMYVFSSTRLQCSTDTIPEATSLE